MNTIANTSAESMELNVNWQEFLARQDMVWDRMPGDYFEGPFVGNGWIGAILFADDQVPNTLRFELGRTDVYDHRAPGSGMDRDVPKDFCGGYANPDWRPWFTAAVHDRVRLPIGQLLLTTAGVISSVRLRVDLWNAEILGTLTTDAGSIDLRCFAPSGRDVLVVEVVTTAGEDASRFSLRPQQATSPRLLAAPDRDTQFGVEDFVYIPNPDVYKKSVDGVEVAVQPLLAGSDYATAWREVASGPAARTVFLSIANRMTTTGSESDAIENVRSAMASGIAEMEAVHRSWWHGFYPASFVSIPDAGIESFYWIQLYKMGSAMREAAPVVDLMGPWFKPTVWAAYWHNLNTQLAYYTVHITNHLELGETLCRLLEDHVDELINNVPAEYRHDSAAVGNPTGIYDLVAPAPGPVREKLGTGAYQFIALPWFMQHFYLQYRHTIDDVRLRESIYPLLRRTFNTYLHVLDRDDEGRYHIPPALSDEYDVAADTSMNLALLRWGLETLLDVSVRLGVDDPLIPKWREVLADLSPYPLDPVSGIMVGKDMPFSKPHRHYSHLFAIFPLYLLNVDRNPGDLGLMRRSIDHFLSLDGDNCMYKFTGASCLYSALGMGAEALASLQRALTFIPGDSTVTPNTLYSEIGGWQTFESPISASRSLLDMLLQSWGGTIRIFPACPPGWADAAFHDLRAEGGFLVSAVRRDGMTQFVRIRSCAGEPCRIKADFGGPAILAGPAGARLRESGGMLELDLKSGEEAIVMAAGWPADFTIGPVASGDGRPNSWGLPNA